jgi:hypothetical protein
MKDGAEGDEGKQSLVLILATCSSHWEKAVHGFRVWLYNPIMSMLKHWKNRIMNDETELKEHGFYFLEDTVISSLLWLAFRFGKKARGLIFVTPPPFWAIRGGRSNLEESSDCSGAKECFVSSSDWIFFSSRLFESELSTELLTFFSSAVRHFQQRAFMLGPFNRRLKTTWCGILYQKEKKKKVKPVYIKRRHIGSFPNTLIFCGVVCSEGNPTLTVSSWLGASPLVWIMFRPTGYCFIWLNKCEIQKGRSLYVRHVTTRLVSQRHFLMLQTFS